MGQNSLEFSFSGLKTAVLNYLKRSEKEGNSSDLPDVAASFQAAVVEVLVEKTISAAKQTGVNDLVLPEVLLPTPLCANYFKRELKRRASFYFPDKKLCTDNAAMVACAGYYHYLARDFTDISQEAYANYPLIKKAVFAQVFRVLIC